MAKRVGFYKEKLASAPELAAKYPSMRDSFSEKPVENKNEIIDFILNAGELDVAAGATAMDVFTDEDTGIMNAMRTDGMYKWGMDLAYYVERYNLRLPDDFVAHALSA